MIDIKQVADDADVIIDGYAFSKFEISKIQAFIKENYEKMYEKWAQYSENGFYNK